MAEVENLYQTLLFSDLVVNQNRTMEQLSHSQSAPDDAAHVRKTGE